MVRKNNFEPSYLEEFLGTYNTFWNKKFNKLNSTNMTIKKYYRFLEKKEQNIIIDKNLYIISIIKKNLSDKKINKYIYFISDKEHKYLYISIGINKKIYWYSFETRYSFKKNFKKIINCYVNNNYKLNYNCNYKAFIKVNNENNIFLNNIKRDFERCLYTENYLWGSVWKDYPFREDYVNLLLTNNKKIKNKESMRQLKNKYKINCRTKYSKSIISVENCNGILILNVNYDQIDSEQIFDINKKFNKKFPNNMPIDIVYFLINYELIDIIKYLELSYKGNKNQQIVSKINNSNYFKKKDLEKGLKYLRDNTKDKEFKKNVKSDLTNVKKY